MKKRKLVLKTETIRVLDDTTLRAAAGGTSLQPIPQGYVLRDGEVLENGFIMKDSVIVRTSR